MNRGTFWAAASERAGKTLVEAFVALLIADWIMIDLFSANWFDALTIEWPEALTVGVIAALVSLLFSLISAFVGRNKGPSLGGETLAPTASTVLPPE